MRKLKEEKIEDMYPESEVKRYLGALSEIHNEGLKVIAEGQTIINRKLDEHTKILDSHTKILDSHTRILNSHTEMIGTLMEDVDTLKEDVSEIKKELKKKVSYGEFNRRVGALEART